MSSAAHFVLSYSDLLSEILRWLRPNSPSTGNHLYRAAELKERDVLRRTLFSAALVCRAFSQHALDQLWYALDHIQPLLQILPSYVYRKDAGYDFWRIPTSEEWTRLEPYAYRVRVLAYDTFMVEEVLPHAWILMAAHFGGDAPLLPRLERLVLRNLVQGETEPASVLLGTTLRYLSISFTPVGKTSPLPPHLASVLSVVLDTIAARSPGLATLHLDHWFQLRSSESAGAHPLARLNLVKLGFCQCPRCAVADLRAFCGASPLSASLRFLVLAVRNVPRSFVTDGLRSLEELSVLGEAGDIDAFIRGIQPTSLHTADLKLWRGPDSGPDEAVPSPTLASICSCLPSAMHSLELNLSADSTAYPPFSLTAAVAALRPFKTLAVFTLHAGLTPVTDVEVGLQMLAELCPELRSLTIGQYPGLYAPAAVTPHGLAAVARSFPKLESLSLPRLDAAELLSPENDVPVVSHGMRSIEFRDVCGVPEPSLAARAIARLFPQLRMEPSVEDAGGVGGEWHGEWKHVRALLRDVQDM